MRRLWPIMLLIPIFCFSIKILHTEDYPLKKTLELIEDTKTEILLASYSLDHPELISSLNKLITSGVNISVIIDDSAVERLMINSPLFKVTTDGPGSLMHSKFIVIDSLISIIGTGNFTTGSLEEDSNSFIFLESKEVAENLRLFHRALLEGTGASGFSEDCYDFYLLPDDAFNKRIIEEIMQAKKRINFMCYAFTSPEIMTVLKYKASKGISIQGIIDDWNNDYSPYSDYLETGMEILVNPNDFLVHDKTVIIDEKTVITGSANFTKSAYQKNRELVVIIKSESMAERFLEHFSYIREVIRNGD